MIGAFLFGKLPAHGDFVCRGMSPPEREAADRWLCSEMAAAKEALGERFQDRFEVAPPWRFVREENGVWAAGALAPSADASGRLFPILVGRRGLEAGEALAAAAACEDRLFDALAGRWSADRLADEVAVIASAAGEPPPVRTRWWIDGGDEAGIAPLDERYPEGLLRALLGVAEALP